MGISMGCGDRLSHDPVSTAIPSLSMGALFVIPTEAEGSHLQRKYTEIF